MSQKLKGKQSRISQLQQEIMTENEERVYLYKVNLRLEEELEMMSNFHNKNQNNAVWELERYEQEIEHLKGELAQRKK